MEQRRKERNEGGEISGGGRGERRCKRRKDRGDIRREEIRHQRKRSKGEEDTKRRYL